MFPTTYIVAVAPAAVAPALTSFSGLLQEVEQYGGCLVHTHLLCVLAARLWQETNKQTNTSAAARHELLDQSGSDLRYCFGKSLFF